jgi:coenzyme F420-reducing hydrogenase gamma subunit
MRILHTRELCSLYPKCASAGSTMRGSWRLTRLQADQDRCRQYTQFSLTLDLHLVLLKLLLNGTVSSVFSLQGCKPSVRAIAEFVHPLFQKRSPLGIVRLLTPEVIAQVTTFNKARHFPRQPCLRIPSQGSCCKS